MQGKSIRNLSARPSRAALRVDRVNQSGQIHCPFIARFGRNRAHFGASRIQAAKPRKKP
jgi:hypothetical protein